MIRRIALASAAVAAIVALPAQAAPKAQLYYFGNVGEPVNSACTQSLQLLNAPTPHAECTDNVAGANNTGRLGDEAYSSAGKATTLKLDAARPVTGTIHIVHIPAVSGGAANSLPNLPGYAKAVVTVKLDAVKVGQFTVEGVVAPVTGLKKDFSLPMPSGLKNKTAKKVSVTVDWIDAVGLVNVSYTDPAASTIVVPVR